MQVIALSTLASFIAKFPVAWSTFQTGAQGITFNDFKFVQDRGSWVLTDNDGNSHVFREYENTIVALTSYTGNFVFVDGRKPVQL